MILDMHQKAALDGILHSKGLYRHLTPRSLVSGIIYALSGKLYCQDQEDCENRRLIKSPTHCADEVYRFQRQKDVILPIAERDYKTDTGLARACIKALWDAGLLSKTQRPTIQSDIERPDNPVAFVCEDGLDYSTKLEGIKV